MRGIESLFRRLLPDRVGASTIEMGLIVSMIVLAMMAALKGLADENSKVWNKIQQNSEAAISPTPA